MSLGQFGWRPAASQRLQRDYRPCGHRASQARRCKARGHRLPSAQTDGWQRRSGASGDAAEAVASRSGSASACVCFLHKKGLRNRRAVKRCENTERAEFYLLQPSGHDDAKQLFFFFATHHFQRCGHCTRLLPSVNTSTCSRPTGWRGRPTRRRRSPSRTGPT